jgi:hypothetical protein
MLKKLQNFKLGLGLESGYGEACVAFGRKLIVIIDRTGKQKKKKFFSNHEDSYRAYSGKIDRLCDSVVRIPGYRSRGPGSIPDATRFSEK